MITDQRKAKHRDSILVDGPSLDSLIRQYGVWCSQVVMLDYLGNADELADVNREKSDVYARIRAMLGLDPLP